MPMTCTVDRERDLLLVVATGRVSGAELLAHVGERARIEPPSSPLRGFVDATGAALGTITSNDVVEVVEWLRQVARGRALGATAIVVGDDASYRVTRLLEVLAEDVCRVRPFRDREAAEQWLDGGDA